LWFATPGRMGKVTPMLRVARILVFTAAAAAALAAEPPIPARERAAMLEEFTGQITTLTAAIAQSPRDVSLYSRRGDRHLFLARFAESVADFEKMIALDPAQDAPHWRLGIAYYFTGHFAKSAKQFEKYHAYDSGDRENGIWKLLGDVKVHGLAAAQRSMLVYTRFDREPFPSLYEMFAGKETTRDLFAGIKARNLADTPRVMFFANYYAGLHEDILGHREEALRLLHAAVANSWGRTAENGPAYMWQVARLHYEQLAAAKR
jgi:lipoprotein NlpI